MAAIQVVKAVNALDPWHPTPAEDANGPDLPAGARRVDGRLHLPRDEPRQHRPHAGFDRRRQRHTDQHPPTTSCRSTWPATRPTRRARSRRDLAVRRQRHRRSRWCVRTQRSGDRRGGGELGHSPRLGHGRQPARPIRPERHRPAIRERQRRRQRHRAGRLPARSAMPTRRTRLGRSRSSSTHPTTATSATATAASQGATRRTRDAPGRSRT